VSSCGVCRTDLHVVDAELPGIKYPIVPGHEIVGRVDLIGSNPDLAPCPLCADSVAKLPKCRADNFPQID
jgi:threonine dehydrogenase-like Zn-dependent dehydrogenase